MPLTVTVNQNDIDTGVPKDCWACPVQKAIQRITLPDVTVTVGDQDMVGISDFGIRTHGLP